MQPLEATLRTAGQNPVGFPTPLSLTNSVFYSGSFGNKMMNEYSDDVN